MAGLKTTAALCEWQKTGASERVCQSPVSRATERSSPNLQKTYARLACEWLSRGQSWCWLHKLKAPKLEQISFCEVSEGNQTEKYSGTMGSVSDSSL